MKKGVVVCAILLILFLRAPLRGEEWSCYQSEHFIFYYRENHLTQTEVMKIAEIQEELFLIITDTLHIEFKGTITYYLHKNRDEFNSTAPAYCSGKTIHFLCDICHDICKKGLHDGHELTHALSTEINDYQCFILTEGLAVYMHNHIMRGENLHGVMKELHNRGELPTLTSVYFDFWSSPYNYYIAGSFVMFLIEEYGMNTFKLIYMGQDIHTVYRKSLYELEQEWIETFAHAEVTSDVMHQVEYMITLKDGVEALYTLGIIGEYGTYPTRAQDGFCQYKRMQDTDFQAALLFLEEYNTAVIAWKNAINTFKKALKTENIHEKTTLFEKAVSLYKTAGDWEMVEKSQKYAEAYYLLMETHNEVEKNHVKAAEKNLKKAEKILEELNEHQDTSMYHTEIQILQQQLRIIKIAFILLLAGTGGVLLIKQIKN